MNARIIKYIIVGLILSCFKGEKCDYIEDYYQIVYKAEIHYLKNENEQALTLLKEAESKCGLLNQIGMYEPIMMAELLVRTNNEKKAFPYLYRTLQDGMTIEILRNNPELETLKKHKEWEQLEKDALKIHLEFEKSINQELRKEIVKMNTDDQKVRTGVIDYEKLVMVDSINENRIKEIFTEFGFPNYKLIGHSKYPEEDTDIGAMLMHFNDTVFFKPFLLKFIRNGQAMPSLLSSMIDSQQRSVGIFTYGTYQNVDSSSIRDFKNIDKRRKNIGVRSYKLEKEYWKLIRKKYGILE